MRKFSIILLVSILINSNMTFASINNSKVSSINQKDGFSLLTSHNYDLSKFQDKIELYNEDLEDAIEKANQITWNYSNANEYANLWIDKLYNPYYKRIELERQYRLQKDKEKSLKIELTKLMLETKSINTLIENQNNSLSQSQLLYANLKNKYVLGLVTNTEVKESEIKLLKETNEIKLNEINLHENNMNICSLIGIPLEPDLKVNIVLPINEKIDYSIYKLIDNIETFNEDLIYKQEEIDALKYKIQIIKDHIIVSFGEPDILEELEDDLADLNNDYDDTMNIKKIDLFKNYYLLAIQSNSTEINKLNYDAAVRNYNTAKVKHDLGMITDYDLDTAKASQDTAYQTYVQSMNDLYIQDLEFQNSIGIYGVEDTSSTVQ